MAATRQAGNAPAIQVEGPAGLAMAAGNAPGAPAVQLDGPSGPIAVLEPEAGS